MTTATAVPFTDISRRVVRLQIITIVWMVVEAAVSLGTAWHAHSPALFGFGGDSLIELLSAAVVLCQFRFHFDEARAARIAGALLFALAGLVVLTSVLNFIGYREEAQRSLIGICILLAAAMAMPVLASEKRKLAAVTSSAALKADAAESALCGYMAWIALVGLAVNLVWGKSWADPMAALALTPLILREGWDAIRAQRVCCHCSD
jgi:divalent metal cation (Fe/Co/Zn/Cd) transporter